MICAGSGTAGSRENFAQRQIKNAAQERRPEGRGTSGQTGQARNAGFGDAKGFASKDYRGSVQAMRVLICDQETEMLETIARTFEVDVATSKVTCIDLMRANPFDVVVASERLSDGSGLELLSHIATRWPQTRCACW